MTFYISVIPKYSKTENMERRYNTFVAKKLPVIKRVLHKRKGVEAGPGEATVTYKTKVDALNAAAKVRNHVHGVTAKVYKQDW